MNTGRYPVGVGVYSGEIVDANLERQAYVRIEDSMRLVTPQRSYALNSQAIVQLADT